MLQEYRGKRIGEGLRKEKEKKEGRQNGGKEKKRKKGKRENNRLEKGKPNVEEICNGKFE